MTERYNSMEREMGISTFCSTNHEGFAAVSKARYSDFVVHEVDTNGTVARLESLQVDEEGDTTKKTDENEKRTDQGEEESSGRKRKFNDKDSTTVSDKSDVDAKESVVKQQQENGDDWTVCARSQLSEWVDKDVADNVVTMLSHWENGAKDTNENETTTSMGKNVTLPPISDKAKRRSLHEWIRSSLPCARADTMDGQIIRIWHVRFEKEMPNYNKFDNNNRRNNNNAPKRKPWPRDRPDFLRFVLYKENADTSMAVKEVSRLLNRHKKKRLRVGYAGMKDKRGVTSQFCTLYHTDASELIKFNRIMTEKNGGEGGGNSSQKGVSVMRAGNFEYVGKELTLGMLNGNRFDVVLRNVEAPKTSDGGNDVAHTKKCLTRAATSLRDYGFINYFGMQRFGKFHDTHKVGVAVLHGDFESAVDIIMRPKDECEEPPKFANARTTWQTRFSNIGNDGNEEERQAAKASAESQAAKLALREFGRFVTCEVSILKSLMHKPCDYKRAFCSIPKNLRLMFLHALQSYVWNHVASYRIDKSNNSLMVGDLVLVNGMMENEGGSGTSGLGGKTVKIVTEEDVSKGTFDIADLVLPLVGSKIQYPQNESGMLFDTLIQKEGLTKQKFDKVKDRELSLGGDYRRVICKPRNVDYEIKEYHNPRQPLLQTDLMKLNNIQPEDSCEKPPPQMDEILHTTSPQNVAESRTQTESMEAKPTLLAMVIGFTLPASAYATMALRELMKRPTSSDYQRKLMLEGPCERNLLLEEHELKE